MFYRLITIALLLITSSVGAADYSFLWQHNPPMDEVVNYRIYWRIVPNEYVELRSYDVGMGDVPLDINNWPHDTGATVHNLSDDAWCFVVTAFDCNGYESDHSNEVCVPNAIRWKIRQ